MFCHIRSYSTLSIASSRSSLTSDLREIDVPSPLPAEISKQTSQSQPSPLFTLNQENIAPIPEISADGFVLVQSDNIPISSDAALQSKGSDDSSPGHTIEESYVNPLPESQNSTISSTSLVSRDAQSVSHQEVTRIDNRSRSPGLDAVSIGTPDITSIRPRMDSTSSKDQSKPEKKYPHSVSKGNSKTGNKPKASGKLGKKDKPKKGHGRTDERSIEDTQSELSYQPDIDLSSKPQISKKARRECFVVSTIPPACVCIHG